MRWLLIIWKVQNIEGILGMTNEPKLRVIFSEQGRKKALAMTAEEKQALNYFTDLYVKHSVNYGY